MKLAVDNTKLESNMEREQSTFGIGDMSVVLEILTKLYSNPIQTLTQEYISNARDAMREAKNTKDKIIIKPPTTLNPVLSIRDYGVGLSEERIKTVFLLYGNSTKRGGNDQTGGFGIGAKSAWSYTDSFNVTSFLNGMKSTYICHKSNSTGNMDRIAHEKTTERDGVLIEIAVKNNDVTHFNNAIERTIHFWSREEMPIVHNLETSERILGHYVGQIEYIDLNSLPNHCFKVSKYDDNLGLVIDGIFYKLNTNLINKIKSFSKLKEILKDESMPLIHLNNGQVQIAPNREEIVDNDFTVNALEKIFKIAYLKVLNEIESKFSNCKEISDHIKVYSELTSTFNIDRKVGEYTLKDNTIYSELIGSTMSNVGRFYRHRNKHDGGKLIVKDYHQSGRWGSTITDKIDKNELSTIDFTDITNNVIYYIDKELSAMAVNNHVRTLLEDGYGKVILIPNDLKQVAIDLNAVNLSTVKITKLDRTSKVKISNESFQLQKYNTHYGAQTTTISAEKFKSLDKFYWTTDKNRYGRVKSFLAKSGKNVFDFSKKAEKALSGLKNAIKLEDYIAEFKDDGRNYKHHVEVSLKHKSLLMNSANVGDATINDMVKYTKINTDKTTLPEELISDKTKKSIEAFNIVNERLVKHIAEKYPLLSQIGYSNKWCDVVEYINLKHNKGV